MKRADISWDKVLDRPIGPPALKHRAVGLVPGNLTSAISKVGISRACGEIDNLLTEYVIGQVTAARGWIEESTRAGLHYTEPYPALAR